MTEGTNYRGLASPDGSSAKSNDGLGAVVRSGLAGAAVGIAVAAVTVSGAGLAANHDGAQDRRGEGPKIVFVTSGTWTGDLKKEGGGSDGLSGADKLCQAAADGEGAVVPGGDYIAWLSSPLPQPGVDARDRLPENLVGYVLPDGTPVADNKRDLLDGTLRHAIDVTQFGGRHIVRPPLWPTRAWTGSDIDGVLVQDTCSGWTVGSGASGMGMTGLSVEGIKEARWTEKVSGFCRARFNLYCIQK